MQRVVTGLALAVGALVTAESAVCQPAPPPAIIRVEFRVFDGVTDVSAETRLRVRPSGSTETGQLVEGSPLAIDLPAGIYDVQAVRHEAGALVSVRWAEQLVVMAYPDEGGRHLEVINFASEHGALQLRWPGHAPAPMGVAVTATRDGAGKPAPARLFHAPGYVLLVLPSGTYDVRITRPDADPIVWPGVEVPADRTRMKVIR